MATSTYGDLHPGSRRVGMMLRNLSALEVRIPPRTVIHNVQAAEIVPSKKAPHYTSEVLPSTEQTEPSCISQPTCITPQTYSWASWPLYLCSWNQVIPPQNVMCWISWISWGAPNGTPWINKKCKKSWEFVSICAKDNLDLGWNSVVKHKITLKEGAKPIKECYRRVPPGLYDVQNTSKKWWMWRLFDHQIVPWLVLLCW